MRNNKQIYQSVAIAYARVNLVICEATLEAVRAVTTPNAPSTSPLIEEHEEACADAFWQLQCAEAREELEPMTGTEVEWKALSDDDKAELWEDFHINSAQGIADKMYFYQVLMNKWLVGYVGH